MDSGYFVSTVGLDEGIIRAYILSQRDIGMNATTKCNWTFNRLGRLMV